jgi:hypothetical protein
MVDAHPSVAIPPESYFLVTMAKRRKEYELRFAKHDYAGFLVDLAASPFTEWGLSSELVGLELDAIGPTMLSDSIRIVYGLYARQRGKPRFADKTPRYVLDIPLLSRLLPDALFVHVIRDGRSVALSYMDRPFGPRTVPQAAIYWRRRIREGRAAGVSLGPNRYYELEYEELTSEPEKTLRRLCGFLALEFDAKMLDFSDHAALMLAGTQEEANHPRLKEPLRTDLRNWRLEMEPHHAEVFEILAGDDLEELGYERSASRPAIRSRFEAHFASGRTGAENVWDRWKLQFRREQIRR